MRDLTNFWRAAYLSVVDHLDSPSFRWKARGTRRRGRHQTAECLEARLLLTGIAKVVEDDFPGGGINSLSNGLTAVQFQEVQGTTYIFAGVGNSYANSAQELYRLDSEGTARLIQRPSLFQWGRSKLKEVNGQVYATGYNDYTREYTLWRLMPNHALEPVLTTTGFQFQAFATGVASAGNKTYAFGDDGFYVLEESGLARRLVSLTEFHESADSLTTGDAVWVPISSGGQLQYLRATSTGELKPVDDGLPGSGVGIGVHSRPFEFRGSSYFVATFPSENVEYNQVMRLSGDGPAEIVDDGLPGAGINRWMLSSGLIAPRFIGNHMFFSGWTPEVGNEVWWLNNDGELQLVEDSVPGGGVADGASSLSWLLLGENTAGNDLDPVFWGVVEGSPHQLWSVDDNGIAYPFAGDPVIGVHPEPAGFLNGFLFFSVSPTSVINPTEFYRIDLRSRTSERLTLPGNSYAGALSVLGDWIYFVSDRRLMRVGVTGQPEIVDSTRTYYGMSVYMNPALAIRNSLFFSTDQGMAQVSGNGVVRTPALIASGENVGQAGWPNMMAETTAGLFFVMGHNVAGTEIWRFTDDGDLELVEDATRFGGIGNRSESSQPTMLTNHNGNLYFLANDGLRGKELWRANPDGDAQMVVDMAMENQEYSTIYSLTNAGGTLYFAGYTSETGRELWRIDDSGNAGIVADLWLGAESSDPWELTEVNGLLYFIAQSGESNSEWSLWKTSPETSPTRVDNGLPGSRFRWLWDLQNVNGTLYFSADDGTNGDELWRLNSAGSAEMVEDDIPGGGINPTGPSIAAHLQHAGSAYVLADDGTHGIELWQVNPITGKLKMLDDALPGPGAFPDVGYRANLVKFASLDDTLFFTMNFDEQGEELWRMTSTGVIERVGGSVGSNEIYPGWRGSSPFLLTPFNDMLYFSASDGVNGDELWRVGETGPAELVAGGLVPGTEGSNVRGIVESGGSLFIAADVVYRIDENGDPQRVLDAAGAPIVPSWNGSPSWTEASIMLDVHGTLYFAGWNQVWKVGRDGIALMIDDAIPGGGIDSGASVDGKGIRNSGDLTLVGETLFFTGDAGLDYGEELWSVVTNFRPADVQLSAAVINENAGADVVVGRLITSDPDADDVFQYSLVSGPGRADNALFALVGDQLFARTSFDFETDNSFQVRFRSTDSGGLSIEKSLTIHVVDVNERPTVTLTSIVVQLPEQTISGTGVRVADIGISDDAMGTNHLSLSGPNADRFEILNQQLRVRPDVVLDYETLSRLQLTVEVNDPDIANTPDHAVLYELTIVDINEAPYLLTLTDVVASLPENTATVNSIRLAGIDVQDDALGSFQISLSGRDAAVFDVRGGSLHLRAGVLLNFEAQSRFEVSISVDDASIGGSPDLATSFVLSITDVYEPPVLSAAPLLTTIRDNVSTQLRIGVAELNIDVAAVVNPENIVLNGSDAVLFEVAESRLWLKAGVHLNGAVRPLLSVSIQIRNVETSRKDLSFSIISMTPQLSGMPRQTWQSRPQISWTPVPGAVAYEVWVNDLSRNVPAIFRTTVSSSSTTTDSDFALGRYAIWVRSVDSVGLVSRWSTRFDLTVNPPVDVEPLDRFLTIARPTIRWAELPGAARYDFWLDQTSARISQYVRLTAMTTRQWSPATDLPMEQYRAWVRGIAADGTPGTWSRLTEFYVAPAPVVTLGLNSTFDRTPIFGWSPVVGAATYDVTLLDRNTGRVEMSRTGIVSTSLEVTQPLRDGSYRWYVLAVNTQGIRSQSASLQDIYIGGRPKIPVVNVGHDRRVRFQWDTVEEAAFYEIFVSRVDLPQSGLIRVSGLLQPEFTSQPLVPAIYRVWLRSISTTGELSPWSSELTFVAIPNT